MSEEKKPCFGYRVLRGFTNNGMKYRKDSYFIPRSHIQRDWLETLINLQLISPKAELMAEE